MARVSDADLDWWAKHLAMSVHVSIHGTEREIVADLIDLRAAVKPFSVQGPRATVEATTDGEHWVEIHVRTPEIYALRAAMYEEEG